MATPYRVGTRSARTDLYGIGKGEAQLFDLSGIDKMTAQRRAQEFAQQQATTKAKRQKLAKREEELMKLMAKSRGAKLKPGDEAYFQKAQADLNQQMRDALNDNEISNDEYMKIIGAANQINAEAEMSGSQKLALEKTMGGFDPRLHRGESLEAARKAYETQGRWGEQFNLIENIDINAYYQKSRAKERYRLGEKGEKITEGKAREFLKQDILGNATLMDQVKYNEARDSGGKLAYEDISDEQAANIYVEQNYKDFAREAPAKAPRAADRPSATSTKGNPAVTFKKVGGLNVMSTSTGIKGEEAMVSKSVSLPKLDADGNKIKKDGKTVMENYNVRQPTIHYDDYGDIKKITAVRKLTNDERGINKRVDAHNAALDKMFRDKLIKYKKKLKKVENKTESDEDLMFIDDFVAKYGTDLDNPTITYKTALEEPTIEIPLDIGRSLYEQTFKIRPETVIGGSNIGAGGFERIGYVRPAPELKVRGEETTTPTGGESGIGWK